MALINCPECNAEVSDTALRCSKCGVQLRKPTRSGFGKFVKWVFILFNILMLIWMVAGLGSSTEGYEAMSEAEKAGTAIGTGLGAMFLFIIWAVGDVILGIATLLTRPKS